MAITSEQLKCFVSHVVGGRVARAVVWRVKVGVGANNILRAKNIDPGVIGKAIGLL